MGVIDAISGQDMQAILGDVYKLPEDLIDRARKAVGTDKIR